MLAWMAYVGIVDKNLIVHLYICLNCEFSLARIVYIIATTRFVISITIE